MNTLCNVIKDLIPLYTDGTAGESSNKLVKMHLKHCADCRAYYRMCRHSKEGLPEKPHIPNTKPELVYEKDGGYLTIARRLEQRLIFEKIAVISAVIAAVVTMVILVLSRKNKKF